MVDEDREKAEKVAAAKKRVEQMKKQRAKKVGGGGGGGGGAAAKKKEEKTDAPGDADPDLEASSTAEEAREAAPAEDEGPSELPGAKSSSHGRKPSLVIESRQRSESFYRSSGAAAGTPTSAGPLSPGGRVTSGVYREQAQKIEELDKENRRLATENEEHRKRWIQGEEELERLREEKGDTALAVAKGKEAERLKAEVESLRRQLSQAQSQSTKSARRISTAPSGLAPSVDDLDAQVASKSATIESLELEISSLHRQLSEQTGKANEVVSKMLALESAVHKAEQEASSTRTELSDLKTNLQKAGEQTEKEGSDRDSAQTCMAQLEAELGAANRKASDSVSRAELLEKKIETLTQLHRDNDARNQIRLQEHKKVEREAAEMRARVTGLSNENARLREAEQRRRKTDLGSIEDSSVQELLDEERDGLLAKVRELEEDNFELRRGVWRDRRRDMQPNMDDQQHHVHGRTNNSDFDEVDLSGPPPSRQQPPPVRTHSSFQDVINSGISAFTGQAVHHTSDAGSKSRPRQESLASLDEFEIDEDAFRLAQEQEAKNRIERVKEVKRGLVNFAGWRVDLVDIRAGMGGVFEV